MLQPVYIFWIFLACFFSVKADIFPSLISTNATFAVILDREYLAEQYDTIKEAIETYMVYAKREILKHGGVNIQYYSWTRINVKRDITAILSVASCADTWELFFLAEEEKLLHMAITETDCPRLPTDQSVTIPLTTLGEEMPQLLLDLRTTNTYNWKTAVILYDHTLSRDMVTRVIYSLTREAANIKVKAMALSLIKLQLLGKLSKVKEGLATAFSAISTQVVGGNFLVVSSLDNVEVIMNAAKNQHLVNTRNQWLYLISDTTSKNMDLDQFRKLLTEGDNVSFLYNTTISNDLCTGGLQCHVEELLAGFTHALDEAIVNEYDTASLVSDEEWEAIRPLKEERRNFLLRRIQNHILKHGICDNCTRWAMHSGDTWGGEFQGKANDLVLAGNWRPTDGAFMTDELFPHSVHGFRQKILPIVSFHNPPWQILKINQSGDVTEFGGLVFDIIKELARNLNFTYTVEVIKADFIFHQNLTLTEIAEISTNIIPATIIDMVRNKSAAIGAGAFTVTENKKHWVNFTDPVSIQTYTFLVARPKELSRALLFMSPFTKESWLCLASAIVAMGPILYYIHYLTPFYEVKGIQLKGGLASIQNCIWYMYGAILQQGGLHVPQADSARVIVGAWWIVVLVVSTSYCGNLVAFLTFPKIDIPITTIGELLKHQDTVTWSIPPDTFMEEQLMSTPEPRFQQLYAGRLQVNKSTEMIHEIERGNHVFVDWKIRLQYIMKKQYLETDRCDMALGLEEFYDEQLAMILAHGSPYLDRINEEIRKLHQVGLIDKWIRNYLPKRDRCWKNRHIVEVNNHNVNMDDMQGSFFVLFIGYSLSVVLVLGELLLHRYTRASSAKEKLITENFTS